MCTWFLTYTYAHGPTCKKYDVKNKRGRWEATNEGGETEVRGDGWRREDCQII